MKQPEYVGLSLASHYAMVVAGGEGALYALYLVCSVALN